jgi:hypothetical protein
LKQEYLQQIVNKLNISEKTLTLEQQEHFKILKEELKQINKVLKNLDEINWNLRPWQNQEIDSLRTQIYQDIQQKNL